MCIRDRDSDAYFAAPSPTLYVIGAALTDLFTLVLVQAVVLKPNSAVAKPIINSFILTIRVTLYSVRHNENKRLSNDTLSSHPSLFYVW